MGFLDNTEDDEYASPFNLRKVFLRDLKKRLEEDEWKRWSEEHLKNKKQFEYANGSNSCTYTTA